MTTGAPPSLAQIQAPVAARLDRVVAEMRRLVASDFGLVAEVNEYLLALRGKLFRPTLLLLCNEVGGSPSPRAETLAAAVELVHLATLVHDDAVDHSALRRGRPTVNARWSHQVAIIMGDFLYTRALTALGELGDLEAVRILADASNTMSVGEMRQLLSYDRLAFAEADYDQLIACKTAALIRAACELGALVGRPDFRAPLARFGFELGMAFQIADDLLDYTADAAELGKPVGWDLREHKVTLPLIAALPHFNAAERAQVEALFADPEPDEAQVHAVIAAVARRGGLAYARQRAEAHVARAAAALEGLPESSALQALRDSLDYVVDRRR